MSEYCDISGLPSPIVLLEQRLNKTISEQGRTINQLKTQVQILSDKIEKLSQQSSQK
jgi:uncharacterized coiled-coil protein SlyX